MKKKISGFMKRSTEVNLPLYILLNVIIAIDIVIFIIEQVGGK